MKAIEFANATDIGMVRKDNQDFYGKFPERNDDLSFAGGQLFIIADGMGGHKAGREASELAVNIFAYYFYSIPTNDILERIQRGFQGANEHIYNYGINSPANAGMGTTCSAFVLTADHGYIGHVGDSRVYRITKRRIEQLTNDHSNVAEMVRRNILTPEEAKRHPERSVLYRALGVRSTVEIDIIDNIELKHDEYFLMCTDGLYNHVNEKEMKEIVVPDTPSNACGKLIELANERGGLDNITVQIIHVLKEKE